MTGPHDRGRPLRASSRLVVGADRRARDVLPHLSATGAVLLTGLWAGGGAIVADRPIRVIETDEDPFAPFERAPFERADVLAGPVPPGFVGGGWFGWLGFKAGRDINPGSGRADACGNTVAAADSYWALHPNVLRYDAARGQWFDEALLGIIADDVLEQRRRQLTDLLCAPRRSCGSFTIGPVSARPDRAGYLTAVGTTIEHIRAGDIYQANVCTRLDAACHGDPMALHQRLLRLEPAFGCYLTTPNSTIASASPELFLRRQGREVLSSPIKGTRPRPPQAADSRLEAQRLVESAKDRAENVMIVDLVRNDLSRVAEVGSVRVPALLRLEPHPGVWHLVSDVAATLRTGVTDADLLRATFPPGSVTGAPKLRALAVIEEVESVPRGVYTGAIGFLSPSAGLELSVAIRTFEVVDGRIHLGVGAGITASSDPEQEWLECLAKAQPLLAAAAGAHSASGSERTDG